MLTVMIICCKIYLVFFYFRGLREPWEYFYIENFQIYGICILAEETTSLILIGLPSYSQKSTSIIFDRAKPNIKMKPTFGI